jgi:hypothetical protein
VRHFHYSRTGDEGEAKTESVAADFGVAQAGGLGELGEFLFGKGGGDGDGAVVQGDGVPTEDVAGGGEEPVGENMAAEILDDEGTAGDAGEFGEEFHHLLVGEVMEEEAGVDEVDLADGQGEGIADDAGRGGLVEVAAEAIETDDGGVGKVALDDAAHVAGGGADVEEGEALIGLDEAGEVFAEDAMAA